MHLNSCNDKNHADSTITSSADFVIQYHLDDGYDPSFLVNETTGQLNAEYTNPTTGRLEAGPGWSTIDGAPTPVNGKANTYSVPVPNSYFTPLVGYKLLARGSFIMCNSVSESNHTIINDFTLFNCAGFGLISSSNRKTTFNSFSLRPAPFPPPNGTELPARSSSADGIHSSGDFIGPTFDSCFFSALDDDCMAVHGSLYQVQGAGPYSNSFLAPEGYAVPGDVLRFYSSGGYDVLGTATVNSADTSSTPLVITVDHLPQAVQESIKSAYWTNQMLVGSGFSVLNTHTTGNRGRGAIIKASNGLIANNLFEGGKSHYPTIYPVIKIDSPPVSYGGLDLGPEFASWGEADYVHNITLTNNTIRDCNYLSKAGSAFQLHGDGDNPMNGNTNITIQGLTIDNTTASNLYIGASEGVVLGDVTFEDVYQSNYTLWETWPGAVATFQNVTFESVVGTRCVEGGIGAKGVNMSILQGTVVGISDDVVGSC